MLLSPLSFHTMANTIQLCAERTSKESVCYLHKLQCRIPWPHNQCVCTLVEEWGPCVCWRKTPSWSLCCVSCETSVQEGTQYQSGVIGVPWSWLCLYGCKRTFTTMATGGSLCSWVKGQLGEFSLSSNRKAFVAQGMQRWLQLVPCEIAHTAKAILFRTRLAWLVANGLLIENCRPVLFLRISLAQGPCFS